MAQHTEVSLPDVRYTRADFAALRAYLQRLPLGRIATLYYTEDDLERLACDSESALRDRLETMRDRLVIEASQTNPYLADMLQNARRSGLWSPKLVDFLVRAGEADRQGPKRADLVSAWLRPRVAAVLREESVRTLGDLIALIEVRGDGWWKPVRCIGAGKAQRLETWMSRHAATLGEIRRIELPPVIRGETIEIGPQAPFLVPLERIRLPEALSGRQGRNRANNYCQISARNDLDAIDAYLYRFRANEKTQRAYRKELERFLLWCIIERDTSMSSVFQEDCEAYKDFLAVPGEAWIGPRALRHSHDWKPFAGIPSASSQRYGVQAIRSFFEWLVNVRYLAGNPWLTVADPAVAKPLTPIQIDKALPKSLWEKLSRSGGLLDQMAAISPEDLAQRYRLRGASRKINLAAQFRLVKAALLLLGDGGLRREEVAFAVRHHLKPIPDSSLWELDVLGKRNKWRTVFLPNRVIDALRAHWVDRDLDFSFAMVDTPLLSPLVSPPTPDAQTKHLSESGQLRDSGFSQDGLYRVITTALKRIADEEVLDLEADERELLRNTHPHMLRHTFGTQAAASQVPLDVLQRVMGHASLQTTTIYVQAEKRRSIEEMGKFFG
ncbi:phage integrase family protein [Propionivibrio dicarboxylicus]|uniref:Site-specific recombinase XerD n=1 Tax=Propionivibrio dicarboxylicus TaxID=83767 RepID=A0A1G8EUN9_9RHOO|nr:phage integrase family protein [Propionivibrio dicarboxylicus]SDH73527.1 Site-specific recombinase XerD [Propionivibrio dicarboxylicus]